MVRLVTIVTIHVVTRLPGIDSGIVTEKLLQRSLFVVVAFPQFIQTAVDGIVMATLLLPQTQFRQQPHMHDYELRFIRQHQCQLVNVQPAASSLRVKPIVPAHDVIIGTHRLAVDAP